MVPAPLVPDIPASNHALRGEGDRRPLIGSKEILKRLLPARRLVPLPRQIHVERETELSPHLTVESDLPTVLEAHRDICWMRPSLFHRDDDNNPAKVLVTKVLITKVLITKVLITKVLITKMHSISARHTAP